MLLQYKDGQPFASGATIYTYRPASEREDSPRITFRTLIEDVETLAFVDTGGINFLCSPQVASTLNLHPEDSLGSMRLLFRGTSYLGHLHRITMTILAHVGFGITIEVTAFVPQVFPGQEWPITFPCVLGMSGCLERLRFAVDPASDMFYFGELI